MPLTTPVLVIIMIFSLPWPFSVALNVSASRRILQHKYKELHKLASDQQEINFSYKKLVCYVKKHWMMVETGNPQFPIACSPVSSALGVICLVLVVISCSFLTRLFSNISKYQYGNSDYKWSIKVIVILQAIGAIVGSIAPVFRCLSATIDFNLSKKWSKNHLNVLRVEKHWIQRLQQWKHSHVRSHIPGHHCKKIFHNIKNMVLSFCIWIQITVVIICNTICFVPRFFLISISYFFNSLLKRFTQKPNASNSNDMDQDYSRYVLQIEVETNLSKRILRNTLNSITRLIRESEEKEPSNLIKLLKKSNGFHGVLEFDSDKVLPLHQEEIKNCWSLVVVTLTAIALALPNIENNHVKEFISSMREGLQLVTQIEESLNGNNDLVMTRKAARRVWTDVEVYARWLQIDLQQKAYEGKTSKDILKWLGDESIKVMNEFTRRKNESPDHSLDVLSACFTNLPRVITMKCHDDAIEKMEESVRIATLLLSKSKKIMKILKMRQLPNLDVESMAYIDKWHALLKSQIPYCCSLDRIHPTSSSSNQLFVYPNVDADSDWEASEGTGSEGTGSEKKMGLVLTLGGRGSLGTGDSFGPGGSAETFRSLAKLRSSSEMNSYSDPADLRMLSEALRASELNSCVCLLTCHGS
ncbi:hypothetical protein LXL04_033135 [Taraxacum kok-saghyz]